MKRKNKQEQKVWLAASSPGRLPLAIETGGKRPRDEVVWIAQQTRRRLKRITISLCSRHLPQQKPTRLGNINRLNKIILTAVEQSL